MADVDNEGFEFIERRILVGLITNTDYIRIIRKVWNAKYIKSSEARTIATWCIEYFDKYNVAPDRHIEDLFFEKQTGMQENTSQGISDVLENISDEFRRKFNFDFLRNETISYFKFRQLEIHAEQIQDALATHDIQRAEQAAIAYSTFDIADETTIKPFEKGSRERWRAAFKKQQPLFHLPKRFGEFMGEQLIRGGFISFLAGEKVGKTYMLMELMMRGHRAGCNVAFFQAGDLSEGQQLRRIGIYLKKRSDTPKYCTNIWVPHVDCVRNQQDTCTLSQRMCSFGVADALPLDGKLIKDNYIKAYNTYNDYTPCNIQSCTEKVPTIWMVHQPDVEPLTWREAYKAGLEWGKKYGKTFKLATYGNEGLTVAEINLKLNMWKKEDGFIPDILGVDYADLLSPDPDFAKLEYRQQQNKIWKRLRRLSQDWSILLLTATLCSAKGYNAEFLNKTHFSEDKRKFAHVTAMYGLNQKEDEKWFGMIRINEIILREGYFESGNYVTLLQRLQQGRPYIGCF